METPAAARPVRRVPGRRVAVGMAATVAVAVVAALLLWPGSSSGTPSPVRSALAFRLDDVRPSSGSAVLGARPGQPVVLNFFAAWCDPCHAELPLLAALQQRMGTRLQVLGVDVQDNRGLATQLLTDARATFPAGYDPGRDVSGAWGVDGLPVTVFISSDGTVIDYHRGQLRAGDLDRRVKTLLAHSGGSA